MSPIVIGILSAAAVFLGAIVGMALQRLLPPHHLSKEMQDLVKLSAGTIATLTALVLGLLVSSAKTAFDTINNGIVQGSAKFVLLDRALARYGPEADSSREELKQVLAEGIDMVWPTKETGTSVTSAFERAKGIEDLQRRLRELTPQTDAQRLDLGQAQQLANELGQTKWLLIEEAHSELPVPLLVVLVFWLFLLFASFGLFAPRNHMALTVLLVGASAISAAIFLVLELNRPLDGCIKASSAPLRSALTHMGR